MRPFRNAQADLVKAEKAYARQLSPLAGAAIKATDALVIGRLGAIIGDPANQINLGWQTALEAALATSWDRIWRDFTPRRLAIEINTARNRVDRLNMGNLTRETRRQTKRSKITQVQVMSRLHASDIEGTSERWDTQNANRAVKNASGHISRISAIVSAGVIAGRHVGDIQKDLKSVGGKTRRSIVNMAADETQTLNSDLSKTRWEDAGVSRYKWVTVGDDRVREEHAARNGKIFRWDTPPSDGHPGQPYNCRCEAQPMIASSRERARITKSIEAELMKVERERRGKSRISAARFNQQELVRLERVIGESIQQVGEASSIDNSRPSLMPRGSWKREEFEARMRRGQQLAQAAMMRGY